MFEWTATRSRLRGQAARQSFLSARRSICVYSAPRHTRVRALARINYTICAANNFISISVEHLKVLLHQAKQTRKEIVINSNNFSQFLLTQVTQVRSHKCTHTHMQCNTMSNARLTNDFQMCKKSTWHTHHPMQKIRCCQVVEVEEAHHRHKWRSQVKNNKTQRKWREIVVYLPICWKRKTNVRLHPAYVRVRARVNNCSREMLMSGNRDNSTRSLARYMCTTLIEFVACIQSSILRYVMGNDSAQLPVRMRILCDYHCECDGRYGWMTELGRFLLASTDRSKVFENGKNVKKSSKVARCQLKASKARQSRSKSAEGIKSRAKALKVGRGQSNPIRAIQSR